MCSSRNENTFIRKTLAFFSLYLPIWFLFFFSLPDWKPNWKFYLWLIVADAYLRFVISLKWILLVDIIEPLTSLQYQMIETTVSDSAVRLDVLPLCNHHSPLLPIHVNKYTSLFSLYLGGCNCNCRKWRSHTMNSCHLAWCCQDWNTREKKIAKTQLILKCIWSWYVVFFRHFSRRSFCKRYSISRKFSFTRTLAVNGNFHSLIFVCRSRYQLSMIRCELLYSLPKLGEKKKLLCDDDAHTHTHFACFTMQAYTLFFRTFFTFFLGSVCFAPHCKQRTINYEWTIL